LGLAASIVYGRDIDPSTESIIRYMKNAGNMMIFGKLSGLADCESPEHEKEWARILRKKNIVFPAKSGP